MNSGRPAPIPRSFEPAGDSLARGGNVDGPLASISADYVSSTRVAEPASSTAVAAPPSAFAIRRWWDRLMHRVQESLQRNRDPWSRQSLDDGALEFMGARTLLQVCLRGWVGVYGC
jgi:hypothetical protein